MTNTAVEALFLACAAAIALFWLVGVIRAYPTLARVERLALWWWIVIAAVALAGVWIESYPLIGVTGLLMVGLGLLVALDFDGLAHRLARRRFGWGPKRAQYGPAYWRFTGGSLVLIGAFATLGFFGGPS